MLTNKSKSAGEKLSRLNGVGDFENLFAGTVWREEFAFECYGVKIGVRADNAGLLNDKNNFLPFNAREIPLGAVEHLYSICLNENGADFDFFENELAAKSYRLGFLPDLLKNRLRQCAAAHTPEKVFIHAGVVAWKDKIILLPAEGYGGKTTLTAELIKAGAVYYSDEFAVLDGEGLVYPYPKPLSMRQRNSNDSAQTDLPVEHFGGEQGMTPLPVGLTVLTRFQPRARWQPQELSPGQAIIEILKFTNSSLKNPEFAIKVLKKIAIQAKIVKTARGDARKAARAIINLCQEVS